MLNKPSLDSLLAQFPGPVTLVQPKTKLLIALVPNILLVVIGLWLISHSDESLSSFIAVVMFGFFTLIIVRALVFGTPTLTLDGEGFEIVDIWKRSHRTRWPDATNFTTGRVLAWVVFYDDANRTNPTGRLNRMLFGRNTALGESYGLSASGLAGLMRRWAQRATTTPVV